jgi:intracellular multiplication protein IcmP
MPAPASQGQSDNSTGILWGVAALFVTVAAIWFVFKTQIITGYLTLKLLELNVVNAIFGGKYADMAAVIANGRANASTLGLHDLMDMGSAVGNIIRYPFVILMMILAVVVYFSNTTRVFKREYSMKSLAKEEYSNWPQITPVIGLDLIKADIDVGPWAMAMTPMQFCKYYNLLQEVRPERVQGMARSEWDKIDVILKRGETNRLFIMQLGALWQGPDRLPPHARALFAAFAARINADGAGSKLLLQMAASSRGKMNYTGTDALLKKYLNSKGVQKIVQSHAYILTVMASMLLGSREDGVQASADFLWLKPLDRRLWYTLNTVGRQTPFIEVGGVFAHWVAERDAEKKLIVPMIEEATNAVELALKDIVYRRDDA